MTKTIVRVGLGFCDELERLAPQTRPRRPSGDITAASIALRAERLRRLLARAAQASQGDHHDALDAEGWRLAAEQVSAAVQEAAEWRARTNAAGPVAEAIAVMEQHADLFQRLLRSAEVIKH